jgi:pilus assembly protein CpaB
MNGKSAMMLMLAVVCGLGAMYGTSQLLAKSRAPKAVEMVDVVVATKNLKVDEGIKPELITITQMPRDNLPAGSFQSMKDLADRYVQIPILAHEPVVDAKLAPKGTPAGLVARIPRGMRAFAIEINETTGVSGFVLPGHHVDVVQSKTSPGPGQGDAELILQNVQVLAAGQTFIKAEDKSILARTVTLAVTPPDVEALVAARSKGPLTLSLRGVNDTEVVSRPKPPPEPVPPPLPVAETPRRKANVEIEDPDGPRRVRYLTIFHGMNGTDVIPLRGARPVPDQPDDQEQ